LFDSLKKEASMKKVSSFFFKLRESFVDLLEEMFFGVEIARIEAELREENKIAEARRAYDKKLQKIS
jgi:hypothetical protein